MKKLLILVIVFLSVDLVAQEEYYKHYEKMYGENDIINKSIELLKYSNEELNYIIDSLELFHISIQLFRRVGRYNDYTIEELLSYNEIQEPLLTCVVAANVLEDRIDDCTIDDRISIANVYYRINEFPRAIRHYTKAINEIADAPVDRLHSIRLRRAYIGRAECKRSLKDYYGAIDDYKVLAKDDPHLFGSIGLCYCELGKPNDAIHWYSLAIESFGSDLSIYEAECYFFRGQCYLNTDNIEAGCRDLSIAGQYGITTAYDIIKERCQ